MTRYFGKLGLAAVAAAVPFALPVSAWAAPDLQVRINSVSPQPAAPGSQVTAETLLSNTGAHAANLNQRRGSAVVHIVRWFFKERGTGPDRFVLATSMMGNLPAGGNKTVNARFRIPANAPPGMHTICAEIDPARVIPESNESNNRHCTRIRVTPAAAGGPATRVPVKPVKPEITPTKPAIKPGALQRACIDPAIAEFQVGIIQRDPANRFAGRVQFKAVLKNVGNQDFVTGPNQQAVQIHSGRTLLKNEAFGNLRVGEVKIIAVIVPWNAATEFQEPVTARIVYDPDIFIDGNTRNDDCNRSNNSKSIQPEQVNRLFTG